MRYEELFKIRPEMFEDYFAIHEVNFAAFDRENDARLVKN
jgi:predicted N-acetyltransferase YhbS